MVSVSQKTKPEPGKRFRRVRADVVAPCPSRSAQNGHPRHPPAPRSEAGFATVLLDRDLSKAEGGARGKAIATNDCKTWPTASSSSRCLPGDGAVLDVALQLSNVLPTYAVHVSMSTIGGETARELADLHQALGQQFVSAPVLGNPQLAASRNLLVFAAADRETLDRCLPLLECLGRHVVVTLANTPKRPIGSSSPSNTLL
ncbi:NAD(P)-binding domain-containing protein [Paraburkholderia sp. CNPSo 3272]|uniref:NAD(P)-binding domain-containing protein n=1 Tax=Paraburkholderia sp. CNPSo 3272 TaxID=2940931 RepID=UPI0020B71CFE|nr:NAD(P)-binding domain-containing protein [Paraburkholderia sp. CNPSo 3272]MCP3725059.1 NAD(P)-binding domain-containing protein [Paraburkholderia sp. CNPSo 3272]